MTRHTSSDGMVPEPGDIGSPKFSSVADSSDQGGRGDSDDVDRGVVDPRNEMTGRDIRT